MTMYSNPFSRMKFRQLKNGWEATFVNWPYKAYYLKLEGAIETDWMLDHIECLDPNVHKLLDVGFSEKELA